MKETLLKQYAGTRIRRLRGDVPDPAENYEWRSHGRSCGEAGLGAALGGAVGLTGGYLYGKLKESKQEVYKRGCRQGKQSRSQEP